ncbi:hypothetical protein THS27_08695 [Thalassospira sp. MCCC 1A01428]|nr:hypothetical protein THS27_08695 [Thalassospira sp. MCCC 1A01428]
MFAVIFDTQWKIFSFRILSLYINSLCLFIGVNIAVNLLEMTPKTSNFRGELCLLRTCLLSAVF